MHCFKGYLDGILFAILILTFSSVAHAGMCPDETINKYMADPVETTLQNTRVLYAAEVNFRKIIRDTERPLMVLFYNNDQDFSRGLAAVVTCVLAEFPQFKFVAYEVPKLDQRELDRASSIAGGTIKSIPSLYIYRYVDGSLELAASLHEGYRETEPVKKQIKRISEFIKAKVLQ